ncbi:MAG: permease [Desulfotomaculaceae bacterium]|nr:permease [Desulfotomaculaceae bacterium]
MFEPNNLISVGKYFLIISGELLALFIGISFLVALLQEFVTEETVRKYLTKPKKWVGNILGAALGALTPFCSCSTIPILVGLLNGGAAFGASISFLIASPLLNPVILTMFFDMLGWKPTLLYGLVTFIAAVLVGAVCERMGLASTYKNVRIQFGCCEESVPTNGPLTNNEKVRRAGMQTWGLFIKVVPYLIIGTGIGAFIYGFVPEQFIIQVAGPDSLFAIPVAAVIGIPMYIRVETIIPIGAVLLSKGMSQGALMALIIGGAGASIPELTLLAAIFKPKLVVVFTVTILAVAILSGYVFQILQQIL